MTENRDVFSRMYRQRGDPTGNSARARLRLGAYIDDLKIYGFKDYLKIEGG